VVMYYFVKVNNVTCNLQVPIVPSPNEGVGSLKLLELNEKFKDNAMKKQQVNHEIV